MNMLKIPDELPREYLLLICQKLEIPEKDVLSVQRHRVGLNNYTYLIETKKGPYFFRIPGKDTGLFCDRKREAAVYHALEASHLTDHAVFIDSETGLKLTEFIRDSHTVNPGKDEDLEKAAAMLRQIQSLPITLPYPDTFHDRMDRYCRIACEAGAKFPAEYHQLNWKMQALQSIYEKPDDPVCVVHGDFIPDNVLIRPNGTPLMLDWEFCANSNPFEDVATFCLHGSLSPDRTRKFAELVYSHSLTDFEWKRICYFCTVSSLMWVCWSYWELAVGRDPAVYQSFSDNCMNYARQFSTLTQPA